jgi:hypothetical protein
MSEPTNGLSRTLGWLTLAAVLYFAAVIIALHFLRPDLDPFGTPTSAYAVGEYGGLMTSAFLVMAFGTLTLVSGLVRELPRTTPATVGVVLLTLWAVGLVVAASFPIDLQGAPQTTDGRIHRINGPLAFLSLTLGIFIVSRCFRGQEKWGRLHRVAQILSVLLLLEYFLSGALVASESPYACLGQRVLLVTFITWFIASSGVLTRTPEENRTA